MIISIDGVDGTGKSTVSKYISEKIDVTILKGVDNIFVDHLAYSTKSNEVKYLYFLSLYCDSMRNIKEKRTDKKYILDKSIYSVIAFHKALGCKLEIMNLFNIFREPDLKIYLKSPNKEWINRIKSKAEIDWYEKQLLELPCYSKKIEMIYKSLNLIEITNYDSNQTADKIINLINNIHT